MLYDSHQRYQVNKIRTNGGTSRTSTQKALTAVENIILPTYTDYFNRAEVLRYDLLNNFNGVVADAVVELFTDQITADYQRVANARNLRGDQHAMFVIDRIIDFPFMDQAQTRQTRTEIINQRQRDAISNNDTKIEAIREYFDNATVNTNDTQNVHDSKVNKDMLYILQKINTVYDKEDVISQINEYIREQPDGDKVALALATVSKMAEGNHISTLRTTEDNVLCLVWMRSLHKDNVDVADNIQESIYLALVDCWEHNTLVCINGRCGKVIGSLGLVDSDSDLILVNTENYRNQIYKEVMDIVDEKINEALASSDPAIKLAGESYYSDVESTEGVTKLKAEIKDSIDQNISKYTNFTSDEQMALREECYIACLI